MGYEIVTPPATEIITLDQAKAHLKVDTTADDALIETLIIAARQRYEGPRGRTGTAFLTQTWRYYADGFPATGYLELDFGPVQSVASVSSDGVAIDPASYVVDLHSIPPRVFSESWPETSSAINAVAVEYVAGYGDTPDKVPPLVVQTMLVAIGYWYANRGGYGSTEFPTWIDHLAYPLKRRWAV